MIQNIGQQIKSFLSTLKTIYSQQGQPGKILFPALFLLMFCCLCLLMIRLFPLAPRNSPDIPPSPMVYPSAGIQATPTALFDFGSSPFPTLVAPTALPTTPAPPAATQVPTQILPTATETLLPTSTNPPATAASSGSVLILTVNKPEEYVDIQNTGNGPVNLDGWKLVSETGNQSCTLGGILQPNEILRVWARKGDTGLSCGYPINIWNDNQADPAVLYDPQGKEISRYP
jgi:lamin tail-like protein